MGDMHEYMGNVSRKWKLRKNKNKAGNSKYCNQIEECFSWAH